MMRKMHMDERTGIFVFKGKFKCTVGGKNGLPIVYMKNFG